jgi:kynurenine formamidase
MRAGEGYMADDGQESKHEREERQEVPAGAVVIREAAVRTSNWGKWGPDDQLGAVNYITPEKVVQAAGLVRRGKVFSLAMPFDENGPQTGRGRMNPTLAMRRTGTDFAAEAFRTPSGIGFADDMLTTSLQAATHWDALSHIFDRGRMWNGHSAAEVTSLGAQRNGVEHLRDRIVSRGVLLDIARYKGVEWLEPGYAIGEDDLLGCLAAEGVTAGTGDIVLLRTGQMGYCKTHGWGTYAGGDAPGLSFYTVDWLHRTELAGVASDTWGVEVRPNELANCPQPLHQVMIPHIGLLVGELFDLEELAADCAADGCYEFLFVAAPLPITGAVGSPINPQAIK